MKNNMRKHILGFLAVCIMGGFSNVSAQATHRSDAIWARAIPPGTIKLTGKLESQAWAMADSVHIYYGKSSGLPGSGWVDYAQNQPTDPIHTTVKFLVCKDTLYVGAWVPDSTIGGGKWPNFDGFLVNIYDIKTGMAEAHEYFYGWLTNSWGNPNTGKVGAMPSKLSLSSSDTTWQAAAFVYGTTNSDTTANGTFSPDTGYSVEMRFYLGARGYHIDNPNGGVILFSMAEYNANDMWPLEPNKFSDAKAWIQGAWSSTEAYDAMRIYTNPSVTISSGQEPVIPPSYDIPNGENFQPPAISGNMADTIWNHLKGFKIEYGDSLLKATYHGAGGYLSGQYNHMIDGKTQPLLDTASATIKTFFIGDTLFIGANVNDKDVTTNDGIGITIDDDTLQGASHELKVWDLKIRPGLFDQGRSGYAVLGGDGPYLSNTLDAVKYALMLKPETYVNNPSNVGSGYQVEAAIDLTKLGYPANLGDHVVWLGVDLYDYNAYSDTSKNTYTEAWWYRRNSVANDTGAVGPAWCYMDPANMVTGILSNQSSELPTKFELNQNYPNPFNPTTQIDYSVPTSGQVNLSVYNVLGQRVVTLFSGLQSPGTYVVTFDADKYASGVYFYRLEAGNVVITKKMVLIK